jgi:hypothetical protein
MKNIIYAVIVDGQNLKCIDTSNGATLGGTNIIGEVISGPIVTDDRCTVVFKNYMGRKGTVYKLPHFSVVSGFDA